MILTYGEGFQFRRPTAESYEHLRDDTNWRVEESHAERPRGPLRSGVAGRLGFTTAIS